MPNTPNDSDSQPAMSSDSKTIKGTTVAEIVRLVISASTIFVGFAILLGRIYHGKYLETLGIPETDTRIPTLSYAVTSPDVTIAALGIAVVLTGYMWWSVWNHGRHQTSWKRGISGLLLLVVGGFGTGLSLSLGIILAEGLGQVGIWWAISFFIYVLGWALLSVPFGSGVCSDSDCPRKPRKQTEPLSPGLPGQAQAV